MRDESKLKITCSK